MPPDLCYRTIIASRATPVPMSVISESALTPSEHDAIHDSFWEQCSQPLSYNRYSGGSNEQKDDKHFTLTPIRSSINSTYFFAFNGSSSNVFIPVMAVCHPGKDFKKS